MLTTKPTKPRAESRKKTVPLIIEPHPRDYNGLPFITLIQYKKAPMLAIVDNADESSIKAFVLDLCGPEDIDEFVLFQVALNWYENNRDNFPISIEFARHGLTNHLSRIYRALNIEFVSRVIGPVPKYPMSSVKSVKRRRRKPIPNGVEVIESTSEEIFE